jgi:hypothetical protein
MLLQSIGALTNLWYACVCAWVERLHASDFGCIALVVWCSENSDVAVQKITEKKEFPLQAALALLVPGVAPELLLATCNSPPHSPSPCVSLHRTSLVLCYAV